VGDSDGEEVASHVVALRRASSVRSITSPPLAEALCSDVLFLTTVTGSLWKLNLFNLFPRTNAV
jgi:hypothetical protein